MSAHNASYVAGDSSEVPTNELSIQKSEIVMTTKKDVEFEENKDEEIESKAEEENAEERMYLEQMNRDKELERQYQ